MQYGHAPSTCSHSATATARRHTGRLGSEAVEKLWLFLLFMQCSYSTDSYSDNVNIEELQERPSDRSESTNRKTRRQDLMMIPKNFGSQLVDYHNARYKQNFIQDDRHHESAMQDRHHYKNPMHDGRRPNRADRSWQSMQLSSGRKFFYLAPESLSSFHIRPGHIAAIPRMPSIDVKAITITPSVVVPLDIGDHNARTVDNSTAPLLVERRVGAIDVYRTTDQQFVIDNGDGADVDNSIKPLLPESRPGAINAVRTTANLIENAGLGFPIIDPDAIDADDPDVLRMIASPRRPVQCERNGNGNSASLFHQQQGQENPIVLDKNRILQTMNQDVSKEHQGFPKVHQALSKKQQAFSKAQQDLTPNHQVYPAEHLPKKHQDLPIPIIPSEQHVNPKKKVFPQEHYVFSKENQVIPRAQVRPKQHLAVPKKPPGFQTKKWIENRHDIFSSHLDSPREGLLKLQFPPLGEWVRQRYGMDVETFPEAGLDAASVSDNVPQGVSNNVFAEMIANKQPDLSIMPRPNMNWNSLRLMKPSMNAYAGLVYRNLRNKMAEIQSSLPITVNPELGGALPFPDYPIDEPPGAANQNFPESSVAKQFPLSIMSVPKQARDFWPILPQAGVIKQDNGRLPEWSPTISSTQNSTLAKWLMTAALSWLKTHEEDGQNATKIYGNTAKKSEIFHADHENQKKEHSSTRALPSVELHVVDARTTALPFPELGPGMWNRNPWTIWPMEKDAQRHEKIESVTKAIPNRTMGNGVQFIEGDWARGSNDTRDDYNGCFSSGRYISSLEWIDLFHEDSKLIAMAAIAVALFLLTLITTICIIKIYHRQKNSCHCVNLDHHCRLSDVQMAVFHLSFSQREKLSKLMYDKLIEDGLTHLSRYFDGIGKEYAKQMDFNLLFDDLAPTFNLHNLTEANRSQNAPPVHNIDLNDGLEHFLYGERQN